MQDESAAVADIVADARGQLPAKRLRRYAQTEHQQRLQMQHRDGLKTIVQLLDALGTASGCRFDMNIYESY